MDTLAPLLKNTTEKITLTTLIVKNCAVPPLDMNKNGSDVEEILALLDQDLTEEEWMQLYMESIQTEIKNNSEQPENEVFQGQKEKHCVQFCWA